MHRSLIRAVLVVPLAGCMWAPGVSKILPADAAVEGQADVPADAPADVRGDLPGDAPWDASSDASSDATDIDGADAPDATPGSCLEVTPGEFLFFRTCRPSVVLDVTVRSCGSGPVTVWGITLDEASTAFALDFQELPAGTAPTAEAPLRLNPGETARFGIVYRPAGTGFLGTVTFANDSAVPSQQVGIRVYDIDGPHCPTPILQMDGDVPARVDATLVFHGGATCSLDGPITSYRWTVVPPGANAADAVVLSESADATHQPAEPGTYRYCLDACDTVDCSYEAICRTSACRDVVVVAD